MQVPLLGPQEVAGTGVGGPSPSAPASTPTVFLSLSETAGSHCGEGLSSRGGSFLFRTLLYIQVLDPGFLICRLDFSGKVDGLSPTRGFGKAFKMVQLRKILLMLRKT